MFVVLWSVVRPQRAERPTAGSALAPKSHRVHTDASSCHHPLRAVATVTLSALPEGKDSGGTRGTVSLDREGRADSDGRPEDRQKGPTHQQAPKSPSTIDRLAIGSEEPALDQVIAPRSFEPLGYAADVSFQGRWRGQAHLLTRGAHQHRSTESGETPEGAPLISVNRLRAP